MSAFGGKADILVKLLTRWSAADCGEYRHVARSRRLSAGHAALSPSDNPLCPRSQLSCYSSSIVPSGGKSFGDDDGRAPNRICRGDCNCLFRVPASLNQSQCSAWRQAKT